MEQTPLTLHGAFLSPEELEQMTLKACHSMSLGADMENHVVLSLRPEEIVIIYWEAITICSKHVLKILCVLYNAHKNPIW